jgi:hypothetical protein
MAHLLLAVYLLASLMGQAGLVLCQEDGASLDWETVFQTCCEDDPEIPPWGASDRHDGSRVLGDPGCGCVDFSASVALLHRPGLDDFGKRLPPLQDRVQPREVPPSGAAARAPATKAGHRPDLPGYGTVRRILRT